MKMIAMTMLIALMKMEVFVVFVLRGVLEMEIFVFVSVFLIFCCLVCWCSFSGKC